MLSVGMTLSPFVLSIELVEGEGVGVCGLEDQVRKCRVGRFGGGERMDVALEVHI